jgi:uncharacterized surface protein with fasciclin (FAS1) repeats
LLPLIVKPNINFYMKYSSIRAFLMAFVLLASTTNCGTSSSLLGAGSSLMSSLGGNAGLSTFTNLLKTPGLDKLLGSALKGKFTMLAPSNEALASLGGDMLGKLSNPSNVGDLANMLKGQIVPGKLDPSALLKGGLKTAGGKDLNLSGVNMGEVIGDKNFNIIPVDKIVK